jgi:Retrotransposon gag protein/Retroviral aspartyl protease
MSGPKPNKPPEFTGQDLSLTTVNGWIYKIRGYVRGADDNNHKIEIASGFLTKSAEQWFVAVYGFAETLRNFDTFLAALKTHFSRGDDARQLRRQLERLRQGDSSVLEFHSEFTTIVAQIGVGNYSDGWATDHFEIGLSDEVQRVAGPQFMPTDTLHMMFTKAQHAYEYQLRFGRRLARKVSTPTPTPPTPFRPSGVSAANPPKPASGRRTKLTPVEREYLRDHNGCYFCRKLNTGHVAETCPEKLKYLKEKAEKEKLKEVKKESVSALVVESESDSELYSRPKSVPTIEITTQVAGATLPFSLVDCGAMINVLSEDKVIEHAMQTLSIPPMRIHEPVNPGGTVVDRKVVSKVGFPKENWASRRAAEFVVAPLKQHDVILGMPFLATEGILIDPAQQKVILPLAAPPGGLEDGIEDGPREDSTASELETELEEDCREDRHGDDSIVGAPSTPSICPKVKTTHKIVPLQPDLSWIKALEEFDKPESVKLREYLAKFNGITPSDPVSRDEYFAKLNEYFVKRYSDVFTESLPD